MFLRHFLAYFLGQFNVLVIDDDSNGIDRLYYRQEKNFIALCKK